MALSLAAFRPRSGGAPLVSENRRTLPEIKVKDYGKRLWEEVPPLSFAFIFRPNLPLSVPQKNLSSLTGPD